MNPIDFARKLGVQVGEDVKFNGNPEFGSEPWLVNLGNHVELSNNVSFITHDGSTWVFRNEKGFEDILRYGRIIVHDNCFIGMGTCILPGVEIGPNSIIGSFSVVTKKIPENSVFAGNPAKFICSLDDFKEKCFRSMPEYDKEAYKKNKRETVLKILEGKMKI